MSLNPQTANSLNELLANANARVCGRCGTRASIQAEMPTDDSAKAVVARPAGLLWFCFECGNEEVREV